MLGTNLGSGSIICLPIGSCEQHGPHLPLSTDSLIAEQFSASLVRTFGDTYDLWVLPTLNYGFSPEHAWAPGTVSITGGVLQSLVSEIVGNMVTGSAARKFLIVNGHGGNRPILEVAMRIATAANSDIEVCVLNTMSMFAQELPMGGCEVHAGALETSIMLAIAPHLVHLDRIQPSSDVFDAQTAAHIVESVLNRAVDWPWSSAVRDIAVDGIVGADPRSHDIDGARTAWARAINQCKPVLQRLDS
jgi:creatinine amidohydrolase